MAGLTNDNEHTPPQSPRTKGIVQSLVREVKNHTKGIDADVHVTNERIGAWEATQLATDTKLGTMEASIAHIDNSLAALLRHFDDLMTRDHNRYQGHSNNNNYDEHVDNKWDEYSTDSELDDHDARRPVQHNHHGRGGHRRCEVRNNDDVFHKLKFKIPPFDGKYDHNAYISWELAVEQKFTRFEFRENVRVRAPTSEFSDFASVWWVEYGKKHPSDIPQTWIALKRVMLARFVPSYYARDLINKRQQLKQGAKSVEEYYQELQIGMLRYNLEEREDDVMARFVAGLNREIQDILEYKD
jgi:hypothetical protein